MAITHGKRQCVADFIYLLLGGKVLGLDDCPLFLCTACHASWVLSTLTLSIVTIASWHSHFCHRHFQCLIGYRHFCYKRAKKRKKRRDIKKEIMKHEKWITKLKTLLQNTKYVKTFKMCIDSRQYCTKNWFYIVSSIFKHLFSKSFIHNVIHVLAYWFIFYTFFLAY